MPGTSYLVDRVASARTANCKGVCKMPIEEGASPGVASRGGRVPSRSHPRPPPPQLLFAHNFPPP
jgi:hypothetical protein